MCHCNLWKFLFTNKHMNIKIEPSWEKELQDEFEKPYFSNLVTFIKEEIKKKYVIYPPGGLIFNAFKHCPFDKVKVVLIGQDPYYRPGQANGLCFSVNEGTPFPPSLENVFIELQNDLSKSKPASGNLEPWAKQGILLLNAILTVRAWQSGSHQNKGWEIFTDAVIKRINDYKKRVVFILWGAYAQKKGTIINTMFHHVLKSTHPSPRSADKGFFGNKHFSKTNQYLIKYGKIPIDWQVISIQ